MQKELVTTYNNFNHRMFHMCEWNEKMEEQDLDHLVVSIAGKFCLV